ncbi:hypothetical protein JCM18899A_14110 [Nocardioides sp. AN3]
MNKADIIDRLTERLGDKKVAAAALDGLIDIVERSVAKGEKVSITGFGTFETAARAGRIGRNPQTGAAVRIKKSTVAKFRAGTRLKGVANGTVKLGREPKHLPLLPSGVTTLVKRLDSGSAPASAVPAKKTAASTVTKAAAVKKAAPATAGATKTAATTTAAAASAPAKKTATNAATKVASAKKTAPAKKAAPAKVAAKKTASASAPAKKTATKVASAKKAAPARKTAKR